MEHEGELANVRRGNAQVPVRAVQAVQRGPRCRDTVPVPPFLVVEVVVLDFQVRGAPFRRGADDAADFGLAGGVAAFAVMSRLYELVLRAGR